VHAVVAAVTAASKPAVEGTVPAPAPANATAQVNPTMLQPGTGQAGNGVVEDGATAAKKKKTYSCFCCKQLRHYIDDCTVPMCDICESVNHASNAYHLLNSPKPIVAMYGYANEALMFFEVPFRGTYKPKVENAKLAKLTIQGDAMTISEIVKQLKWIVPSDNFQWEVMHFHNNIYKVRFPSKNEVQRMKKFRTYTLPNRATNMKFDEWSVMGEPTFMLPEVWVRVTGIPSDVRNDYMALWALGSLFGKTMEVDMAFTRKNKVLRMRIGCMDASLIPETSDV
jgi:hypothetical protein